MLDELADLLLGACCPGCQRPGLGLCAGCRAAIDEPARWARDLGGAGRLTGRVASAGDYRDPLRNLLSAHKDRGAWSLAPVLGARLALAVRLAASLAERDSCPDAPPLLVPVPSSPRQVRQRGYDHGVVLARQAAAVLRHEEGWGKISVLPALRRVGSVADQSGLGRIERFHNQVGSMRARAARGRRQVIVVDDISTTGASLAEAARALAEAGWSPVAGAVVAHPSRAPKHGPMAFEQFAEHPLNCL
ncbi:ComF family protein [Luteococcus sp. OSA5]|uniref:ComF family protein n=1 Tax=Luteococcus sp. OSA5 TaxID=3401630 RepID=UPI003B42980F